MTLSVVIFSYLCAIFFGFFSGIALYFWRDE
jgi:hypothetical protein